MKMSVFGLGKLGACIAGLYAINGHTVTGVDLSKDIVAAINNGKSPHKEPYLEELIEGARNNLIATINAEEAVLNSDVSFIIVPTPSDENGIFINSYILAVMAEIGKTLRKKDGYHLVVINSTVMPGSSDGEIRKALENASGRKLGENLGLVYSPEFIALGSIIKDMKFPDLVLIGQSDSKAGNLYEKISLSVIESKPEIHRMTLVNAEIVKIAINTFVTTKISFANMLSEICDHLPNADVDVVTNAVGSDSRVGKKYLKGALGYGGPCFPRDNIALTKLAMKLGAGFDVPEATDAINRRQIHRIVNLVKAHNLESKFIAVLGMSYKPDTPVVDESQGIMIANLLSQRGYKVMVSDPMALDNVQELLGSDIEIELSLEEIIKKSEVLIVTTPWPQYKGLNSEQLRNKIIIDCWRIFTQDELPNTKIIYPGRSSMLN
jgi:UDPglucose 6-dehydrogenase